MVSDLTLAWGAPGFDPAGAPDTDGDPQAVSEYFQYRTPREFTTVTALLASTPPGNHYSARAQNAPGALFIRVGGAWVMYGIPRFADATARGSALAAPVLGWLSQIATELFPRIYNGAAWVPYGGRSFKILPSAATNGSVDADGLVTSGAQSLVRIRDAFTGFTVIRCQYNVTMSAAAGLAVRVASGATDATTGYDSERTTSISSSGAEVQNLNGDKYEVSSIGVAGATHVGEFLLFNPSIADVTWISGNSAVAPVAGMTTSTGRAGIGGMHRTATAYDSLTFLAPSGTITLNKVSLEGVA